MSSEPAPVGGDHVRTVQNVYTAARDLLGVFENTRGLFEILAVGSDDREAAREEREAFEDVWRTVSEKLDSLGRAFDPVRRWWLADQPPAFAPRSTSAVAAVLTAAADLEACVLVTGPASVAATCRYMVTRVEQINAGVGDAALRCEAAAMCRRPSVPLPLEILSSSEGLAGVRTAARETAAVYLPHDWPSMSDEEREASFDDPEPSPPVETIPQVLPAPLPTTRLQTNTAPPVCQPPADTVSQPAEQGNRNRRGRHPNPNGEAIEIRVAALRKAGVPYKDIRALIRAEFRTLYAITTLMTWARDKRRGKNLAKQEK